MRTRRIRIRQGLTFRGPFRTPAVVSSDDFAELMSRVRAGHPEAAAELVRQFEPEIRLEVRVRLRVQDPRMRRLLDSMDITQSVFGSFFAGVSVGRFVPQNPEQLLGLLATMTRNKLLTQVRNHRRQRRDVRRLQPIDAAAHHIAADGESPSEFVAGAELLRAIRGKLSEEERRVADLRGHGETWGAIADKLGGTADGRRKQVERALARIVRELNLDVEADVTRAR
jgi:RNA polymerase sigma-70 factor (ECF subfamily)